MFMWSLCSHILAEAQGTKTIRKQSMDFDGLGMSFRMGAGKKTLRKRENNFGRSRVYSSGEGYWEERKRKGREENGK